MTIRGQLRDAVGDALQYSDWADLAAPQSFQRVKSYGQALSADFYPVFGVSTPRQSTSYDTDDEWIREISVNIAWKRDAASDEIETLIDEDADEIERLALAALRPLVFDVTPTDLTIDTDTGDGGYRIGVGTMTLTCTVREAIAD